MEIELQFVQRGEATTMSELPKSRKRRAVILVGLEHSDLADRLRLKGLETMEAASPEAVPSLLRTMPRSAIVVYNRGAASRDAQQVLAAVAALHRRAPVVVLVDETDFGEYYSLMGSGALEYFAMSERPELIVRGIEWATEDRAS